MPRKRQRRSPEEIWRTSSQTRLRAWSWFTRFTEMGLDEETALEKALKNACPPKDDPYYAVYHPHKKREFEIWRKYGLWPLQRPKDVEHDTRLLDSVEVSADLLQERLFDAVDFTFDDLPEPLTDIQYEASEGEQMDAPMPDEGTMVDPFGSEDDVNLEIPPVEVKTRSRQEGIRKDRKAGTGEPVSGTIPHRKKGSPDTETRAITTFYPRELVDALERLPGDLQYHLEEALKLYLELLSEQSGD